MPPRGRTSDQPVVKTLNTFVAQTKKTSGRQIATYFATCVRENDPRAGVRRQNVWQTKKTSEESVTTPKLHNVSQKLNYPGALDRKTSERQMVSLSLPSSPPLHPRGTPEPAPLHKPTPPSTMAPGQPWPLASRGSWPAMVPGEPWLLASHGSWRGTVPQKPWFLASHGSWHAMALCEP